MNNELFEKFLIKARAKYGNKFDYSKSNYINNKTPITIICPIHGEFQQRPDNHLSSKEGCYKCGRERANNSIADTIEDFIEKAKKVHGDKYDYSLVKLYRQTPIEIICKKCGKSFTTTPSNHLQGYNCSNCNPAPKSYSKEEYVDFFSKNYPTLELLSDYEGSKEYIKVKCKIHNYIFNTKPKWLKKGNGCKKCYNDRRGKEQMKTTEQFIEDAIKVHGDKYDYSKVEYKGNKIKVCVICPIHGEFWQTPNKHISLKQGCPHCNESHLEKNIKNILTENNINFERQKRFDWLGRQSLDFYLPDYNIAIECQGEQHFKSIKIFGGEKGLEKTTQRDYIKKEKCFENGLNIIYVISDDLEFPKERIKEKVYTVSEISEKINKINNILQS